MTTSAIHQPQTDGADVSQRLRSVIETHFDPDHGTPYWLDRAAQLQIDARRDVHTIADLAILGQMSPPDLQRHPLTHYIPRRFHHRLDRFIVGQTGGTTGDGTWTAYLDDEFREAFVLPFVLAADHVGFPAEQPWLFVGPTGPHIIGKVVKHLANALGSADPFSVDFDPRWAKRLPEGSVARQRYTQHVIDQAMRVIEAQPIGVLFTTPVVLWSLAATMTDAQRLRVRGVHYGGVAVTGDEILQFQTELFPNAVHLSGYGNTLFGCCLELTTKPIREPAYFPLGHRLIFDTVNDAGDRLSATDLGRVRFTRLDHSMLIVRLLERDQATLIEPPTDAPEGFVLPGLLNPQPVVNSSQPAVTGLY